MFHKPIHYFQMLDFPRPPNLLIRTQVGEHLFNKLDISSLMARLRIMAPRLAIIFLISLYTRVYGDEMFEHLRVTLTTIFHCFPITGSVQRCIDFVGDLVSFCKCSSQMGNVVQVHILLLPQKLSPLRRVHNRIHGQEI